MSSPVAPIPSQADSPTLAEDLLLLLFQPDSGTIAGENTLFYALGAAVLAELGLRGAVTATPTRTGTTTLTAVEGRAPNDSLLRPAWDETARRPSDAQTVLAAIGPMLRQPVLTRVIARGDIRQHTRTVLRFFTRAALVDGETGRRATLLAAVRDALTGVSEPAPRTAALAALVWGSGSLHQFDPEIPWTSAVIGRARQLQEGDWGATAAHQAVTRTTVAIVVSAALTASAASPPQS